MPFFRFFSLLILTLFYVPTSYAQAPQSSKVFNYDGININLVPPPGKFFYDDASLMRAGELAQPGSLIFAVAMGRADFTANKGGSTKDTAFSIVCIGKTAQHRDISVSMFTKLRKIMTDNWSANLKKMVANGDLEAYNKEINGELLRDYNTSVDASKIKTVDLGIVAQGNEFITSGLLTKNNVVKIDGVAHRSDYAIFSSLVLVKQKILTLVLLEPLKSLGSLNDTKASMAKWVSIFCAKNK